MWSFSTESFNVGGVFPCWYRTRSQSAGHVDKAHLLVDWQRQSRSIVKSSQQPILRELARDLQCATAFLDLWLAECNGLQAWERERKYLHMAKCGRMSADINVHKNHLWIYLIVRHCRTNTVINCKPVFGTFSCWFQDFCCQTMADVEKRLHSPHTNLDKKDSAYKRVSTTYGILSMWFHMFKHYLRQKFQVDQIRIIFLLNLLYNYSWSQCYDIRLL